MHIQYVSDILLMHDEMSDTCAVILTKLGRMTANHVCHLLKWLKSIKYQFPQLIIKFCRGLFKCNPYGNCSGWRNEGH